MVGDNEVRKNYLGKFLLLLLLLLLLFLETVTKSLGTICLLEIFVVAAIASRVCDNEVWVQSVGSLMSLLSLLFISLLLSQSVTEMLGGPWTCGRVWGL